MLNPLDPAFTRDPFPYYASLRSRGPATRVALANGTHAWLVTGYDQARAVLADPRFSNLPAPRAVSQRADSPADRSRACLARHMLNSDAPDHNRLRRMASSAFSPRRVDALRPRIREVTDQLLKAFAMQLHSNGTADVVDDFAFPLPVSVIGEVLGVPARDRAQLRRWTYYVGSPASGFETGLVDDAWVQLHDYFGALIADKRRVPGQDLFSDLVNDTTSGGLDDGELLAMAFLLLSAGYETTMNLIASASLLMLTHPAELDAARRDLERWPAVIEETLRHASPLESATWRRATQDVPLDAGVVIPGGASVLVVLAGANRDPDRFPDPDAFRPGRYAATGAGSRARPHLAFGHGPHYCVGAQLARLEAMTALPRLFAHLPGLRLAADPAELPFRPGLLVRGPMTVPVMTSAN